jgi:4-hydroxy-4-methyl-2-oxoglutarate aldolase
MDSRVLELQKYDTASITNVVASYPNDPETCLGLYNPWTASWYTDESIRCMFPNLGPRAGYAVTVQYGLPDPRFRRLGFDDVLRAIEASPKPVILVIKQNFPEAIKRKNGLSGGNMTTAMKALGCAGVVTDGPSRDMQEIRGMDFQYLLTGVSPGHGDFAVEAVNVPVSVCGMDVAPGEIIHMDENGACKFPADKLDEVLRLSERLAAAEERRMAKMRACGRAEDIIAILGGFESGDSGK